MQHEKALFRFGGDRAHEQRCRLRELHACGCVGQAKSNCLQPRFLCPSSSTGDLRAAILRIASSFSISLRGLKLLSCPRNKHDFRPAAAGSVGCFSRRERRASRTSFALLLIYLPAARAKPVRDVRSEQRGKTANWPRPRGLR